MGFEWKSDTGSNEKNNKNIRGLSAQWCPSSVGRARESKQRGVTWNVRRGTSHLLNQPLEFSQKRETVMRCVSAYRVRFHSAVLLFSLSLGPYSIVNADDSITSVPPLAWAAGVQMGTLSFSFITKPEKENQVSWG